MSLKAEEFFFFFFSFNSMILYYGRPKKLGGGGVLHDFQYCSSFEKARRSIFSTNFYFRAKLIDDFSDTVKKSS